MLKLSENHNINYVAEIVEIGKIEKHPNADKLQIAIINHNRVITGMDAKPGDLYVYFPIESAINKDYLSWSNSFEDKSLNINPEEKGFFNKHGRVRAVKLRGELSEGYMVPLSNMSSYLKTLIVEPVGTQFDSWDDIILCEKYVPYTKPNNHVGQGKGAKPANRITDVLVDGQFNFYSPTAHLKKNMHEFDLGELVVITQKLHGSSFIGSHVLVKKKLKWYEKALRKIGIEIPDSKYGYIWSSGKPKSNLPKGTSEGWVSPTGSFYSEDIWKREFDKIKDVIPKGYTIYGEIVGHGVQGDYTYSIPKDEITRMYVYKITITNPDGVVHTMDWFDLKNFCQKYGLFHVKGLFVGKLSSFGDDEDSIIDNLCLTYLEQDLPDGLPDEGVCMKSVRKKEWFKLKSAKFLLKETKDLDAGNVNTEENA